MERSALLYLFIVLGISILALARARVDTRPPWTTFFALLGKAEVVLVSLLLATLIFLGCLQIFLRNVFHSGMIWADPLMRHIVLWLGCLGGLLATARIRHLSMDVFSRLLPGHLEKVRDRIIYSATALASSVLGMATLKLVVAEKAFGDEAFLGVGVWVLQLIMPVTFFLITYRSLVNALLARKGMPIDWEEMREPGEGAGGLHP